MAFLIEVGVTDAPLLAVLVLVAWKVGVWKVPLPLAVVVHIWEF
jgi:hypothetical protein